MRLDLNTLDVQSFSPSPFPESDTDVSIIIDEPVKPIDPETRFHPCTHQLTCKTCA